MMSALRVRGGWLGVASIALAATLVAAPGIAAGTAPTWRRMSP